ncbi:hypothetical protein LTR28_008296, partial [Elasticomyces elasticus]
MALPSWISWSSPTSGSSSSPPIHVSYGLHKRCSSLTGSCTKFPQYEDCHRDERHFCSLWKTVGFMMSFSVVMELATLVAFAVVLIGGRGKREGGWKVVGGLLSVVTLAEMVAMAIVVRSRWKGPCQVAGAEGDANEELQAHLYNND